jgi:hypothetical protein
MNKPINPKDASPKMSRRQAKLFWSSLTPEQRLEFNKMMAKLNKGELQLTKVMVDDNEQIQRIILDPKETPSKPTAPFAKSFKLD